MNARSAWMLLLLGAWQALLASGCMSGLALSQGPYPAGIKPPVEPPHLPPLQELPKGLPARPDLESEPPAEADTASDDDETAPPIPESYTPTETPIIEPDSPLELTEVLDSVERAFPLLFAAEQELAIAAGRRLSAEGAFDLKLNSGFARQDGTFESNRFDFVAEQPTPFGGVSFFSGYRFGLGDFPVYYGNRKTADGGEFRAGVAVPLLRDSAIDPRRAALRQAQLGEPLADAVVRRFRIDYLLAAAQRYWAWVAAGEQYYIAEELLRIAGARQAGLEEQFQRGQIAEFVVIDNSRLIAERTGSLVAAERRFQQASFALSLFLRDASGNPIIPSEDRLPRTLIRQPPPPPVMERLQADIETALQLRPELDRFDLRKEQLAVEMRLAENQTLPGVSVTVAGAQDLGGGKKDTGIFQLDRTVAEAALLFDVPLQRREARGRIESARASMNRLLAEERYARDEIVVDVQDAFSNLDRTYARYEQVHEETEIARRVAALEMERFRKGEGTLLEVNLREIAAAGAEAKMVDALADYYRAQAEYRAALALDAALPPPGQLQPDIDPVGPSHP